jgi:hypothetical protein
MQRTCGGGRPRNARVLWDTNSGLPSEVSMSGMPKVENVSRSALMSLYAQSLEGKMMRTGRPAPDMWLPRGGRSPHKGAGMGTLAPLGGVDGMAGIAVADGAAIACVSDVPGIA